MASGVYGSPLLLRSDEAPVALEPVPMSDRDYDELFIQQLAFEHPECLPVAQIDRAYEGMVPVCMELSCPSGYIDALYVTPTGRLVIAEAKLWQNPEARRKVVGQILDYAKDLSRWNYEDLQREVSKALKRKGNALFQLVAQQYPDIDEASFVDEVQISLSRGRFMLLIVGDGIREGAAAITNFLESAGSLEFTFGLVEMALYDAPEIGRFVQPRVLARTEVIDRIVVQLSPGVELVEDQVAESAAEPELSDDQQFYTAFWAEFLEELRLDDPGQPLANVNKTANAYFSLPPSGGTAWVSAFFSKYRERVGVYITWTKGPFADAVFKQLEADKKAINKELGLPVEWSAKDGKYMIVIRQNFDDVWADSNRQAIKEFFANTVNSFVNTFRGRMKHLAEELDG